MDSQAAASKQHGIGHGAAIMRHLQILTVLADQPPGPLSSQTVSKPGTLVEPQATDLFHWQGHALVVGAGGIGQALADGLAQRAAGLQVHTAGPKRGTWRLDLGDDASLESFGALALERFQPLRLVICTAGLLHEGSLQPEKRLLQVNRDNLRRSFELNAFGPLLLAKALEPALPRHLPLHFASLSARVGSITDNKLGGWYAYRAAKAAQNQLLRTLAIEWRRRLPLACVTALHPGTTATGLSEPFRSSVPTSGLFSPQRAAHQLLEVLATRSAEQSGNFVAWDGQPIPW
jgi:NAD(P)-dependent dehydrogenase (short-subunit alcohol dehydrogenase family)